jgi:hypothetical protein
MELLNGDLTEGSDFGAVSELFVGAMVRSAAEVSLEGRAAFVALMAEVLRTLSSGTRLDARAPAADLDPVVRQTVNAALVAAGLKFSVDESMELLVPVLPSLPRPALCAAAPVAAPPYPPGAARPRPHLLPMIFPRARIPAFHAAMALLASSLPEMPAPELVAGLPSDIAPRPILVARPTAVTSVVLEGFLPRHGGRIVVERVDRRRHRRSRLAFWIGVVGSLVGFPVLLEGLVAQSPWVAFLGAGIVVAALSSDFWIVRALRRSPTSV